MQNFQLWWDFVYCKVIYHKVASSRLSRLVAHLHISDCLWRGNLKLMYCDLWPKEFKIWIVDQFTARNFTVCFSIVWYESKKSEYVKISKWECSFKNEFTPLCTFLTKVDPNLTSAICFCYFQDEKTSFPGGGKENTVSAIVGGKTLYLFNLYDPDNPIELAFQSR